VTKIKNAVLFTDDEGMHFHAKGEISLLPDMWGEAGEY